MERTCPVRTLVQKFTITNFPKISGTCACSIGHEGVLQIDFWESVYTVLLRWDQNMDTIVVLCHN